MEELFKFNDKNYICKQIESVSGSKITCYRLKHIDKSVLDASIVALMEAASGRNMKIKSRAKH